MAEEAQEESVTGADIYESATAVPETPVEETKEEGRARDEKGRFAPREEAAVEIMAGEREVPESEPEPEPEKHVDHRIPLTELLNEREKRQSEQRRADQFQRELEQLRQQIQPPRPAEPIPDQFAQPEQYNAYWENRLKDTETRMAQQFKEHQANVSLQNSRTRHGAELFDTAYNAVMEAAQRGDRGPAQAVAQSPDPGETLVNWYQRESTLQAVGNDPKAYAAKVLEDALNNPEFLAKALEKAKGVATAQPTQVKLPPSLNKATSAGRADDNEGSTDMAMYRHATGRG